jgi:hypothetical protein
MEERRSNRSRKPIVPFDELVQSLGPSKPPTAPKPTEKPSEKPTKPATTPTTKPTAKPTTKSTESAKPSALADPIEELCSGVEALDLKAQKKAKAAEIARLSKLGLKRVMEEAKLPKDVHFDPFDPGDIREPKLNIPSNIDVSDPLELLDLFIPPKIYAIIAKNTNLYATANNASTIRTPTNSRYWWPTDKDEIRVLFGVLIYMGVHKEPNYTIYWETSKAHGPNHTVSKHMSLNRYENLRRYLHISPPEPDIEFQEPLDSEGEHWWAKLEPMLSTFRTACQTYLTPGTAVAIDEIMVRFYGRSSDTCKMPNKPIKQGYKIFALAENGYVWHFQLSSKQHGIGELQKVDELTPTGSIVLQMARLLPKFPNSHYVLYLDNYFTSIPLFSMLRKENIGAAGTTRPSGTDFPALLIVLRKNWATKLDWGTTVADIVNNVLCIGWQDNNFVLGLSTVHTVHEISSFVISERNCPSKTSTNASTSRKVFGDLPFMDLEILTWVDDYNHHMNSVDLANQHRQPYDTQRIAYRTWIPLFHWILDQAIINAYKLASIAKTWPKDSHSIHLEFRRALYARLLDYSKLRLWKDPSPHNWTVRPKRQSCAMCCAREKLRKKLVAMQEEAGIVVYNDTDRKGPVRPEKSWSGCDYCDVPLCKTSSCFKDWHSQKG